MFDFIVNDVGPMPAHINSVGAVVGIGINVLMGAGFSASVVFIGLAGLRFVTAGSNPENKERAMNALTYSIVALVLSLGALAVKTILFNSILGITEPDLVNATPTF